MSIWSWFSPSEPASTASETYRRDGGGVRRANALVRRVLVDGDGAEGVRDNSLRTHIAVEHADGADARLEGNADHADVVLGRRHLAGATRSVSASHGADG